MGREKNDLFETSCIFSHITLLYASNTNKTSIFHSRDYSRRRGKESDHQDYLYSLSHALQLACSMTERQR